MHATDIVGYAFQADTHCMGCIRGIAMAHVRKLDGSAGDVDTEASLAHWASLAGFGSGVDQDTEVFPFPIFMGEDAYDVDGPVDANGGWRPRKCGTCFEPLF